MNHCTCGKTPPAQMLCQDCDEQPVPPAVWEKMRTMAGTMDVMITLARLEERVTELEKTLTQWTGDK